MRTITASGATSLFGHFLPRNQAYGVAGDNPASAQVIARLLEDVAGPILQVGAGHGAITRALLAKPGRTLVAIEPDRNRASAMARQFPQVKVAVCQVRSAPFMLRDMGISEIGGAVGLTRTDPETIEHTAWALAQCMEVGRAWIQLAHTPTSPLDAGTADRLGWRETHRQSIAGPHPAAHVLSYTRC